MQNLDRFYTTSDFDREYLQKETRYKNRKNKWSRTIPPAFSQMSPVNFGPLSIK